MARRRIGQESFGFGDDRRRAGSSLDDLAGLIDWAPVEQALAGISNAAKGEPAWPPLALFKALLSVCTICPTSGSPRPWTTADRA